MRRLLAHSALLGTNCPTPTHIATSHHINACVTLYMQIRWKRRRVARGIVTAPIAAEEEDEDEDAELMADDLHFEDDSSVHST